MATLARTYAAEAIDILAVIMNDGKAPPAARIKAASELLSTGQGTAPRSLDVNNNHSFSDELSAFLRRLHSQETGEEIDNTQGTLMIEAVFSKISDE